MQKQDLIALRQLTAKDYLASGGLAAVQRLAAICSPRPKPFFGETTRIDSSYLKATTNLDLGSVSVCAYDWAEHGQHAGQPFEFAGTATDVFVRRGAGWVHQAHHVSLQHPAAVS